MLKDLSSTTDAELDTMSVEARMDGEGNVVLETDSYWEEKGLRFFKRPLKVRDVDWACFLNDLNSLVVARHSIFVYAFVMSVSKEFNDLIDFFPFDEDYLEKGYDVLSGYPTLMEVSL